MRIALRTSGGRGEYELAGSQGEVIASQLFDKELFYEVTPNLIIPGRATVPIKRKQGKPRIRLHDEHVDKHLYLLLAAILLLPRPKRELKKTGSEVILKQDAYSITDIQVDVAAKESTSAILRPTDLILQNTKRQEQISFASRMARVTQLWQEAAQQTTPLANLIQAHRSAVEERNPDHKDIARKAREIVKYLDTEDDPLPVAENALGLMDSGAESPTLGNALGAVDDDPISPEEARLEAVKQWRQIRLRGAAGRQFRAVVTEAYSYRCLFTGQRLPKTTATASAGVDAAHILPWSTHNINVPSNGICLNKLCHWALDAGVLKFSFVNGHYQLEIPDRVRKAAKTESLDLEYFEKITGEIPDDRLPSNASFWPSPKYLERLNTFMFGTETAASAVLLKAKAERI